MLNIKEEGTSFIDTPSYLYDLIILCLNQVTSIPKAINLIYLKETRYSHSFVGVSSPDQIKDLEAYLWYGSPYQY
ncbi:hypothetical protein I3900191A7_29580 [Clostridium baratii]